MSILKSASRLGRKVVHLLLIAFAITLVYVVLGLVLNYEPPGDVFFALSFVLLFFVIGQSIFEIGIRKALVFLGTTTLIGFLFEVLGTSTGLPFGKYHYGSDLGTLVLNVPIVVPLVWFVIVYLAHSICFSRSEVSGRIISLSLLAAFGAVAWDFLVDPMFSTYGYWVWENNGLMPTLSQVPLSNFLGWFIVAFLMILVFHSFFRGKKVILRENVKDSRIAYALLLIDGAVANATLGHYLVIVIGVVAMIGFLLASSFVSNSLNERIKKEQIASQYSKKAGA